MKLSSKLITVRLSETSIGGFIEEGKSNILQLYWVEDGKLLGSVKYGPEVKDLDF